MSCSLNIYLMDLKDENIRDYNGYFLISMFFIVIIGNFIQISRNFTKESQTYIRQLMMKKNLKKAQKQMKENYTLLIEQEPERHKNLQKLLDITEANQICKQNLPMKKWCKQNYIDQNLFSWSKDIEEKCEKFDFKDKATILMFT